MVILKYNIIDPGIDKQKPYYDEKNKVFRFPVKKQYNYFVQAYQINTVNNIKEYLLLLGKTKFDDSCKKCNTNQYGKCNLRPTGEFLKFIISECKDRGNIVVEYIESDEDYDVYLVR